MKTENNKDFQILLNSLNCYKFGTDLQCGSELLNLRAKIGETLQEHGCDYRSEEIRFTEEQEEHDFIEDTFEVFEVESVFFLEVRSIDKSEFMKCVSLCFESLTETDYDSLRRLLDKLFEGKVYFIRETFSSSDGYTKLDLWDEIYPNFDDAAAFCDDWSKKHVVRN